MTPARRSLTGALVLLAVLVGVILLWQRPDPFAAPTLVRAELSDASGLAPIGADVRVAGVPVGKVTGLTRRADHAELVLRVDPAAGIVHRDASVALHPRLMFEGTAYLELRLGSPTAPALGSRPIDLAHSSTPVSLQDVLGVLQPRTRTNIKTIAAAAAGALRGSSPATVGRLIDAAPALLREAGDVAGAVRGPHAVELRDAVASLASVSRSVAARAPALGRSLGAAATTLSALSSGRSLQTSLALLPAATAELRTGATSAQEILDRITPLTRELTPSARDLAPTLQRVRPLLRRAVPVLRALGPFMGYATQAVAALPSAVPPTRAAMSALRPTLAIFQNSLLDALARRTDLGDPAYLAFLGLFAGGGGASSPFGVDGQGHFMRFGLRFLSGAGQPLPPCTLIDRASPALGAALRVNGACTP